MMWIVGRFRTISPYFYSTILFYFFVEKKTFGRLIPRVLFPLLDKRTVALRWIRPMHAKFTLLSATKTETPWCEGTFCFRIFFETLNVIIGFSDPRSWQNPNYDGLGYRCGGRVGMYLESCLFRKVHVIALWYDPWMGLGLVVIHIQSVLGNY